MTTDPDPDLLARPLAGLRYVILDCEATGPDPETDEPVEIAVVEATISRTDPDPVVLGSWRICPGRPIPPEATAIHGIRDEDVAECPAWEDVAEDVARLLAGRLVVAYYATYDWRLLDAPCLLDHVADAYTAARVVDRYQRGKRLVDVCRRRGVVLDAHGASGDCVAVALVWPRLLAEAHGCPVRGTVRDLIEWDRRTALAAELDDATYRSGRGLDWSAPWHDLLGVDTGIERPTLPTPTHTIGQDGRITRVSS